MALGTPVNMGSAVSLSPGTSLAMTVAASASVGDLIVVVLGTKHATSVASGFSDSAGNTYQVDITRLNTNSAASISFGSCVLTAALTSGVSTITATIAPSLAANAAIQALKVSGVATSSWLDKQASSSNAANTAQTCAATAATTQANEVVIGAICNAATRTAVPTAPYAEIAADVITGTLGLEVSWQIVAATGTQAYACTLSSSSTPTMGTATYKEAAAAAASLIYAPSRPIARL